MEKAQSASVESIPEVLEECTSPVEHSDSASVHDMDYVNPRGVRFTQSSQKEGRYSWAASACSPPPCYPSSCLSLDCLGPVLSSGASLRPCSSQEMESSQRTVGIGRALPSFIQRVSLVDNRK